jgi:2-hydroxy-3-keto-5-methylthiopentenyl-1-phosphate phosphatase
MIIQCDFDGTIINNNMSTLLRKNFAPDTWHKVESDYLGGKLSVEESNKIQFALIREPKETLQKFASQHVSLRPGFLEFVTYCKMKGIPFIIVSSGLDFYIEVVLEKLGLQELEFYCAKTSFSSKGIEVSYYDPKGNSVDKGFKSLYLSWLKTRGREVAYLGDGLSDLDAACKANYVFATGQLSTLLSSKSNTYYYFSDFNDVLHRVRLL